MVREIVTEFVIAALLKWSHTCWKCWTF